MKETKEHIIRAAFLLFMKKSYKAVTLKEIIRETGLSNGAFYHYFESKEQLFREVISNYLFRVVRRLYESSTKDSLWDFIQYTLSAMEEFHKSMHEYLSAGGFNFLVFMFEAIRVFPEIQLEINKLHKLEFASWVEIIDIAKLKGEIRAELPAEVIACMFIYLPDGAYLDYCINGNAVKYEFGSRRLWEGLYSILKI
ncbi:MAG: TetR/AcrR family transcriptional regulator [Tannerella sp.]|jgi:AcrR family transcriptional regulator|nr:TetR/AcrR family transcriptional regulator [Tannerella sp.]